MNFLKVIERLDNNCYYDETINRIIENEAKGYFGGNVKAEEVASIVIKSACTFPSTTRIISIWR